MSEQFPAVASSLLIGGQVVSHTGLVGEGTAHLHPAIWSFAESLPAGVRKPFTGRCAESALVSDQLWALDSARSDGRMTSLDSYVAGVQHGPSHEWYKDGTLRSEGTAREGRPVGASREWHPNGALAAEVEFSEDGTTTLAERRWDEEGRPTKNWSASEG
ncbi:toxin-antitoxin system YwqK family antitoxin [Streptomyces gelaticus]|uniref:toxin-antitoxin system YwqK family antitoxin n=1 Tax=Streptomyces gelaticus TaxID=285446 RepID=UPI00378B414A